VVTLADVEAAAGRISGRIRRTPILEVDADVFGRSGSLVLKLEMVQHSGSFKVRGAFNRILTALEGGSLPACGVIAASGGNAGIAVAHAARELGVLAEIFVPEAASPVKVSRLQELGAVVTVTGALYADAFDACLKRAADTGALLVHAYDQPEVVAGQGTLGLELLDQTDYRIDTVLVAVGGGGLIGGIATAVGSFARVVAVEPELIPTLHAALAAGEPVDVSVGGVAADSLGAKRVGEIAFETVREHRVHSVLVSENAIIDARQRLWDECRLALEYGGAAALAALIDGVYVPGPAERVAVVLCGGNTDPATLARAS
jgi:threonine dehydratase